MNRFIAYLVERRLFVDMLTIFAILIGLASVFLIRREVFPNVTFDIINITTISPGSSAEEVEKLITNPIEQDMQEVDGIKKLSSKSIEGRSYILAQLDPDQTTEEEAKADIQEVVDRFQVPEGTEDPDVTSIKSTLTPIIKVSLSGDLPEMELREIARDIEKKIETLDGVARVVSQGVRDKEIRVEASPAKLRRYRVTLDDLIQALDAQNVVVAAGTIEPPSIEAEQPERIVRTDGELKTLQDVENTAIRANERARAIRVKDVAKVSYELAKPTTLLHTNGFPSVSLTVLKKEKSDAIRLVEDVKALMLELGKTLDDRVEINYVNDFSKLIRRRLQVLGGNLGFGLLLVLVILGIVLQGRVALLVSIGIPFSFLGTIAVFYTGDSSLNLISVMGLIIVSGMLVDDAVVVTDNAVRLMEEGYSPKEASIQGTQQIWPAVLASVSTTIVAFLPMMFMSGIFGKFVREIPTGVIVALLFSLVEAFFILPAHIAHWIRLKPERIRKSVDHGQKLGFFEKRVAAPYMFLLKRIVKHHYVTALFGAAFVGITLLLAATTMKFILFPSEGIDSFFIRVEVPTGYSLRQTEAFIKPIEQVISKLPENELESFESMVGFQQQDANDPERKQGSFYAQLAVHLTPFQSRARKVPEIIDAIREPVENSISGHKRLGFSLVKPGPPVGKPVSLSVRSEEYEDILPVVTRLKEYLGSQDGVTDIEDSYVLGKKEIVLRVNSAEAASAGLSVASIGRTVRAAFEGIEATTTRELDEEIDVRVIFPKDKRVTAESLRSIYIPNKFGNLIPLRRVTREETDQRLAEYQHEDNYREIKVTAEVDTDVTSAIAVNNKVRDLIPTLAQEFPKVEVAFGGEDKDTQESMASLARAFAVAALGIFLILVFLFENLFQPVLILLTIPLGVVAVVWAFFFHNKPLSFMGMLSIIALGGVIVNNSIMLIDFVNKLRAKGLDRYESIMEAARIRLRPIFLTSLTTVAGLLPTAYGIGGFDPFVVPIALGLGWGLLGGSVLVSLLLPAAIAIMDDIQAFWQRLVGGTDSSLGTS